MPVGTVIRSAIAAYSAQAGCIPENAQMLSFDADTITDV